MKVKSFLFVVIGLLNTACAGEADNKILDSNAVVENVIDKSLDVNGSEVVKVPDTEWYYVNMEGIVINLMNNSKNEFLVDDGIGQRRSILLIESQRNRGVTYPVIVFLSKKGPISCDYSNDIDCVVNIQFSETEKWPYPATVVNNSVRSVVTIYDDDFLDKLKEFDELVVELPVTVNRTEDMVFDIKGFRQKLLEFDSE